MAIISRINKPFRNNPIFYIGVTITLFILLYFAVIFLFTYFKQTRITAYDYPGSVWESKEPYLCLEVSEKPGGGINGFIQIGDKKRRVCLQTTAGLDAKLCDEELFFQSLQDGEYYGEMVLLEVVCKYSNDKIVLKVSKDYIYSNKFQEITLVRIH